MPIGRIESENQSVTRKSALKLDLAVAAIGIGGACLLWPAGGLWTPESSMSIGEVLRVLAALILGAVLGMGGLVRAVKDFRLRRR